MVEPDYFAVNRKLLNSEMWLEDPFTRGQAWVDLIGLARHSDGDAWIRGRIVRLLRGQLAWSVIGLSDRWKWSQGKVKRFLEQLENGELIARSFVDVTLVLTIVNYDKYQTRVSKTESKRGRNGEQTERRRRGDGEQTETKEKGKKEEEGKREEEDSFVVPEPTTNPPVLQFPTSGDPTVWNLTTDQVENWRILYPSLDVVAECRKALAWVQANNRKTARGMSRFLVTWLNRANDSARPQAHHNGHVNVGHVSAKRSRIDEVTAELEREAAEEAARDAARV